MSERGKYIVIEGHDGTGKSLQVSMLEEHLKQLGIPAIQIHEPDGALMASKLRDLIKDGTLKREPWTNVMLFTTARRVSWFQHMKPALEKGIFVLAARNWLSTIVYQGYGQRMPIQRIRRFTEENVSSDYLEPDLTLVLTLNDEVTRQSRISERGKLEKPDTFESMPLEFQKRVRNGYEHYAKENNLPIIDATPDKDKVESAIWEYVKPFLPAHTRKYHETIS
jgi:dTMP kinase